MNAVADTATGSTRLTIELSAAQERIKVLEEGLSRIARGKGDSISGHLPAAECRRIAEALLPLPKLGEKAPSPDQAAIDPQAKLKRAKEALTAALDLPLYSLSIVSVFGEQVEVEGEDHFVKVSEVKVFKEAVRSVLDELDDERPESPAAGKG